jgi:hypothetical protein
VKSKKRVKRERKIKFKGKMLFIPARMGTRLLLKMRIPFPKFVGVLPGLLRGRSI